jgi:hypothetical protein
MSFLDLSPSKRRELNSLRQGSITFQTSQDLFKIQELRNQRQPSDQANAPLPKDWNHLTKEIPFADLARQYTPSHFLDESVRRQTRSVTRHEV